MKKITNFLFAILMISSIGMMASQKKKVLFIGIDGCRADALQQAYTPRIDSLIAHGFFTFDSWHLGTTVSGPSWSSMLCGVNESKHGVTDNSFSGAKYKNYPAFPKRALEKRPNLKSIEVNDWQPLTTKMFNDGFNSKVYVGVEGNMVLNAKECIRQLRDTTLDVLFAYYGQPDWVGHSTGFSPKNPTYMNMIRLTDSCIGLMLDSLKARPTYKEEEWLILVCTDHGGVNYGHGGNSDVERHIWWIASNDKIKNNTQITCKDPGSYKNGKGVDTSLLAKCPVQSDIAVTALHWLLYDINIDPTKETAWALDGKSWLSYIIPTFTKVEEAPKQEIKVMVAPNPFQDILTIYYDNPNKSLSNNYAQIFDINGKLMLSQTITLENKINLNTQNLPNGNYIVTLNFGKEKISKQIIKN